MENRDTHRLIKCSSENKQTGNKIDVELWDEEFEAGLPPVVIFTDREALHLAIRDIPGLIISLISLLVKRMLKRIK